MTTAERREYMRKWRAAHPGYKTAESRKWRKAHPAYNAAASKKWRKANPEKSAACDKNWAKLNPQKLRAHWTINGRIARGALKRQPCEVCGNPRSQAHHENYLKPLEVVWLCALHHKSRHRQER
jgi:hypothetical protein